MSEKLEIYKERVLKASEECEEAREVLEILFPGAFEKFKVGDIVEIKNMPPECIGGKAAKVIEVDHRDSFPYRVKFQNGIIVLYEGSNLELLYREESEEKFKVGDIVEVIADDAIAIGSIGKIVDIDFDRQDSFHWKVKLHNSSMMPWFRKESLKLLYREK